MLTGRVGRSEGEAVSGGEGDGEMRGRVLRRKFFQGGNIELTPVSARHASPVLLRARTDLFLLTYLHRSVFHFLPLVKQGRRCTRHNR